MGQSYLKNAALLTGADIVLRLAGMGLRIWLANALGGEGMGLYQLVLAVYSLFVTLATSGVSVAATRLMAEELSRSRAEARGMLVRLLGAALLLDYIKKRKFNGDIALRYLIWYGVGRFWIEGLRTDSLYLFNWELFGQRIRVSQALSIVMVAVAAFMLFYNIRIKKRSPESLWVHQVAAEKARLAAAEAEDAVLAETLMNEVPTEGEAADPLETEAVETPDAETVPDTETQEKPEKGETHGNEN